MVLTNYTKEKKNYFKLTIWPFMGEISNFKGLTFGFVFFFFKLYIKNKKKKNQRIFQLHLMESKTIIFHNDNTFHKFYRCSATFKKKNHIFLETKKKKTLLKCTFWNRYDFLKHLKIIIPQTTSFK